VVRAPSLTAVVPTVATNHSNQEETEVSDDPGDLGFEITRDREGATVVVHVRGDVDVATSPRLREELHQAIASGATRLVVDMTDMAFIDSAGLGVLIGALKRAREREADVVLRGLQPSPSKVFAITGLDAVFTVEPS
jgi:anti-sigma B factor antagonist